MKKLSLILMFMLVAAMLFGCKEEDEVLTPPETVAPGIAWSSTAADKNLVGAWLIENDEEHNEIYLFTNDCKIRIVKGSCYFEGDVTYGIDTDGNHKYLSDFYYMAGELTYVVDGDKVIFVNEEGVTRTMVKTQYSAPQLKAFDDFSAENPLVGTWYNEEYNDSYTFNADGTAAYDMDYTEQAYKTHIDYTYKVVDDLIYFTYDTGDGAEQYTESFSVKGDTLNIIGTGEFIRK